MKLITEVATDVSKKKFSGSAIHKVTFARMSGKNHILSKRLRITGLNFIVSHVVKI